MKGMILAAGFGTRFRPVTWSIPKPMVPLCNRPLAGWAVEPLLAAGITEIVVNLHHLPEPIEEYLRATYGERCTFHFSREAEILGTGGGVRRVRSVLEEDASFFLVNGDTVQFPPLERLEEARRDTGALAALVLRHAPADDRFTPVWLEGDRITGIGDGSGEALMFAGAHAIGREIFGLLPDREFSGITEDVYQPLLAAKEAAIAGVVDDGLWFDIGTPLRYLWAADSMLRAIHEGRIPVPDGSQAAGQTSLVVNPSRVDGELWSSVVGRGTRIAGDCRIVSSHLWDDVEVGEGVVIERSVVAHGVSLPRASEVRNALVCRVDDATTALPHEIRRRGLSALPIDPEAPFRMAIGGSADA
jgi:mannose-1-phosphate guanylyltransferase